MQIVAQYADQHADQAMQIDLHFNLHAAAMQMGREGHGDGGPKSRKFKGLPPSL